jgi:hypothetical protein
VFFDHEDNWHKNQWMKTVHKASEYVAQSALNDFATGSRIGA